MTRVVAHLIDRACVAKEDPADIVAEQFDRSGHGELTPCSGGKGRVWLSIRGGARTGFTTRLRSGANDPAAPKG